MAHNTRKDPPMSKDEADAVVRDLLKKMTTESAHLDKENSFHFARTGKRDVVIHMAVTILPRQDGHTVIGERERELGQWCFELQSQHLPASVPTLRKAFSELMSVGYKCLTKMGAVKN